MTSGMRPPLGVGGPYLQPSDVVSDREHSHLHAVSVVIPSLAPTERLERCLEALAVQTVRPVGVWVVLSRWPPSQHMQDGWPWLHVLRCPAPPSFCRAVNTGMAATDTPWVLLLNDDVVVAPDFVERLLHSIPSDARIGMVCGKLLSGDGRRLDSTGQFRSRAWTAVERGHGSWRVDHFNTPGEVFSVPAAAALYRRTMLEAIAMRGQYVDERLGMYLEDLDLGCRAQRAGWRAYYVPDARARHIRGATAKTRMPRWSWLKRYYLPWLSPKLQARYILNRYQLRARYGTRLNLLLSSPWLVGYEIRLWTYLLVFARPTIQLMRRSLNIGRHRGSGCAR